MLGFVQKGRGGTLWASPFYFYPMGILGDILRGEFRGRVAKYNSQTLATEVGLLASSRAGAQITPETALAISAVYACVYKIAGTLASLPIRIMQKQGSNLVQLTDHPVQQICAAMANPEMQSVQFWEGILSQACLYGKGYAVINRDNQGRPEYLIPADFGKVQEKEVKGTRVIIVEGLGTFNPADVLIIRNLMGASPIMLHRENLGLTKSAQDYGAEFFSNGGQMTGVLSSEQILKPEQVQTMQSSWNNSTTKAGTKLLPFGFKYTPISVPPESMLFIETRAYQTQEICRMFMVPPAVVFAGEQKYSNHEQQAIQFRQNLGPWIARIESEIEAKLLNVVERPNTFARFNMQDLNRTDSQARSQFYKEALESGWVSINEVREMETMNGGFTLNPIENGSEATIQVNRFALSRLGAYSDKISEPTGNDSQT